MSGMHRSRAARQALLAYQDTVRALDALRRKLVLADGRPHVALAGLGVGLWQVRATVAELEKAAVLNRRAAACLKRLGRVMQGDETVLRVLQRDRAE